MKNKVIWVLSIFVAFIFVQSMFFKFSGAEETIIIFNTIGQWISSVGLPESLATGFAAFGAYAVGLTELAAAALIVIPVTRHIGATISLGVISGAIFFHLFTPLGVDRIVDQAGNTDDGALFYTALAVWLASAAVLILRQYSANRQSLVAGQSPQPEAA